MLRATFIAAIAGLAVVPLARAEVAVDVALVLAVDVSRSMSHEEMRIQRRGYAAAISSPEVLRAIAQGPRGRIAVTLFEWAGDHHAREIVGWTMIETRADAEAVAAKLLSAYSQGERRTSISGGIDHAVGLLETMPYAAQRRVIDVSGDGPNNQGLPVTVARDAAVRKGITINGLPLMTEGGYGTIFNIPDLDEYYRRCVIGGPGAFMIPVDDWDQFAEAVRRKLVLEIGGLMPPGVPDADARVMPAQFDFQPPYDCLVGEKIWRERGW
ncbi:DUF1194 domain-containing protein [Stappia sp. ES.058]|uniref:DUF1194 domain-containing protein n=1 Tax=Stappia sp. ES.058 TaxID=1881061 RepID=UPI001FCD0904|nr:DUF1194 domain-containing protein [Stappia sp. ES.058]